MSEERDPEEQARIDALISKCLEKSQEHNIPGNLSISGYIRAHIGAMWVELDRAIDTLGRSAER